MRPVPRPHPANTLELHHLERLEATPTLPRCSRCAGGVPGVRHQGTLVLRSTPSRRARTTRSSCSSTTPAAPDPDAARNAHGCGRVHRPVHVVAISGSLKQSAWSAFRAVIADLDPEHVEVWDEARRAPPFHARRRRRHGSNRPAPQSRAPTWSCLRDTPKGRRLVDAVTVRRRDEIATIAANIPTRERAMTVHAPTRFGEAAGEPADAARFTGDTPQSPGRHHPSLSRLRAACTKLSWLAVITGASPSSPSPGSIASSSTGCSTGCSSSRPG